ncbi:MAG: GNAT family N-acetyltransferase [Halobacteriovoraceae bacterium]|jgi:ribosomal protein S18 acetylase RimI-like enzyme|nr:GNAT family N-acetyltransferase [Halobacteriovoraceae bacterium]
MKFEYLEKGNPEICDVILRSVPDWFGIEESTLDYINKSKELPMLAVTKNGKPIGFLSLKKHSPFTSEVYVMGVIPEYHRKGVGKKLLIEAEKVLAQNGVEFLQVKTVSADRECEFYRKTRLFYKSFGFKEVEVFPTLWDEHNPCQLLIKSIPKVAA